MGRSFLRSEIYIEGRHNMAELIKNLIDGKWEEASTGETFESINPANTSEVIGNVVKSGKADIDRAVKAAQEAYGKWRLVPPPRRAEILFRAAEILVKRKQELGELMTREMGKVLPEALGDVQEAHRYDLLYGG